MAAKLIIYDTDFFMAESFKYAARKALAAMPIPPARTPIFYLFCVSAIGTFPTYALSLLLLVFCLSFQ